MPYINSSYVADCDDDTSNGDTVSDIIHVEIPLRIFDSDECEPCIKGCEEKPEQGPTETFATGTMLPVLQHFFERLLIVPQCYESFDEN